MDLWRLHLLPARDIGLSPAPVPRLKCDSVGIFAWERQAKSKLRLHGRRASEKHWFEQSSPSAACNGRGEIKRAARVVFAVARCGIDGKDGINRFAPRKLGANDFCLTRNVAKGGNDLLMRYHWLLPQVASAPKALAADRREQKLAPVSSLPDADELRSLRVVAKARGARRSQPGCPALPRFEAETMCCRVEPMLMVLVGHSCLRDGRRILRRWALNVGRWTFTAGAPPASARPDGAWQPMPAAVTAWR